jgi:hypothetical protein
MYHRVEFVAKAQCVPEKELVEFARVNHQKYGIVDYQEGKVPMVSTWYCDDLVRNFRKQYRG